VKSMAPTIMSLFDSKEKMYRTLARWNEMTFGDARAALDETKEDAKALELLDIVIEHQHLEDKRMNGNSSEKLKKKEFEKVPVTLESVFRKLEDSGRFWTPLDYLYEICKGVLTHKDAFEKKAKQFNMTFNRVAWLYCGRAMRALPSFIREHQLAFLLADTFPKAKLSQSQELDIKYHCDIKIDLEDKTYYAWSFIKSPWAAEKFQKKLGDWKHPIPDGCHLICPFDRDNQPAVYHGWLFYSEKYMDELKSALYQQNPYDYVHALHVLSKEDRFYTHPSMILKTSMPVQAAISN